MKNANSTKEISTGYEVTRDGRVFSLEHNWRGYGKREMVQEPNADGYPSVRLTVKGRRKRYPVYKLVAVHHLDVKPSDLHLIRHRDGDRTNSHADNLAWGTSHENALDRVYHMKNGRMPILPAIMEDSRRRAKAFRRRLLWR